MKLLTASTLLLASTSLLSTTAAMAEEYQSISSVKYANFDSKFSDTDSFNVNSIYFLDKKSTLGPLDEFEYINKTSNVSGNYFNGEHLDSYKLAGELFIDNVLVGGSYQYTDFDQNHGEDDLYNLSLGYLFSDNILIKAVATRFDSNTRYFYSADYNHQINDSDYIGFTYSTDEDFDAQTLSTKYFTALGQGNYLTAGLSYTNNDDFDNDLSANVEYFFNSMTSVSGSYDDDDNYTLSTKHFFNKNYALSAGYSSNASSNDFEDYDQYTVDFTAQF